MKFEQINKLDGNLIGRLKLIVVGLDLLCDQFLIFYSKKLGNIEVINYRVVNLVLSYRKLKIQFFEGIFDFLIFIEFFFLRMFIILNVGFSFFFD